MSLLYGDLLKKENLFDNVIYQFKVCLLYESRLEFVVGRFFLARSIFNFKVSSFDRIICCQIRSNITLDEVYQEMYELKKLNFKNNFKI